MFERARGRRGQAAAAAVRIALVAAVALVPLGAAACGNDASEDAASPTPSVAETVAETVTETVDQEGTTTGASPARASSGPVVRFAGNGDLALPPVRVGRGGGTVVWRNQDAVFSLFSDYGLVIDSVEPRGEGSLRAGLRLLEVIASGGWRIEIRNARRAR